MRPKFLEMSAWGPYKDVVTIDFEAFDRGTLFLVTGPTGSGKTTIFDGICFAIYGDTSGKEREKSTLRSDFAHPDTPTYVRFLFTHNGLDYQVERNPEYLRPKKRRNAEGALAYTTEKENAILRLPDGSAIEGVTTVNRKLQELMALDYTQFKQISMIAQGEFDRLLTAPSQEKTKIFRGIFGTGKYDLFTQLLKAKASSSYKKVSEYTSRMKEAIRIHSGGEQELEELAAAEHINYAAVEELMAARREHYQAEAAVVSADIIEKEQALNQRYAEYSRVVEQRRKLEQLKDARERYNKLLATREQYEATKKALERAGQAGAMDRTYQSLQDAGKLVQGLEKRLADAERTLKRSREAYLQAEQKARRAYEAWQQADMAYKRATIGIVADMLVPGKPCPVCGSMEHPAPFVSDGTVPNLEQVEHLQKVHAAEKQNEMNVYGKVGADKEAYDNAGKELQEATRQYEECRQTWKETLEAGPFATDAEYLDARLSASEEAKCREKVSKWEEMVASTKAVLEHLVEETKDLPNLDQTSIEAAYAQAKKAYDEARDREHQVRTKVMQMRNGLNALRENRGYAERYSKEYGVIKDLENMASGNNPKRLVFEQYVLSSYFEDILDAANIRFRHMTMDRYEMIRKAEVTDARTKDHLDIMIVDYYTGKTRPVSTLSGGERFHASLALALGMSDVIQAYQGGIRVETLFVDEGFGSLDEESLQAACDSLYQLTEGDKLVGIISHVDSLKQRIDNRIEICKTNMGSTLRVVATK